MALLGNTKNYWLGNGNLYLAEIKADGSYGPERHLGTITDFNLTVTSERTEYRTSNCGVKEKVLDVVTQVDRSGTFTLDDTSWQNLALSLGADLSQRNITSSTVTGEDLLDVEVGYIYPLGVSTVNPAGLHSKVSSVVVEKNGTPLIPGTRVKNGIAPSNADYIVDLDRATIEILPTGSVTDGDDLEVDYTVEAVNTVRLEAGSVVGGLYKLRFKACNLGGENRDALLPKVSLSPSSDIAFKGDEVATLGFEIEVLVPDNGLASIILDGRAI